MMTIHPGDLRVFRFGDRAEVFVPASDAQIARFYRVRDRDLPRRFVPMIEVLEEAFPRIAAAYRRSGIGEPDARIGADLDEYENEPDAVVRQICKLSGVHDLRLTFRLQAELECFLQAHDALAPAPEHA
jgi:hypothetical protein